MSLMDIIVIGALGVMTAGLIVGSVCRHRHLFSALFVVGIVGLAVALTIVREQQLRDLREANAAIARSAAPTGMPVELQPPSAMGQPPMASGSIGSSTPPSDQDPYAGDP
jgi:hypothetical protein